MPRVSFNGRLLCQFRNVTVWQVDYDKVAFVCRGFFKDYFYRIYRTYTVLGHYKQTASTT
jgi:hypothetical protein